MATDRREGESDTEELATTIGLYILGEISLVKAAERVGVTRWEMQEILEDNGVDPRLGPVDMKAPTYSVESVSDPSLFDPR